MDNQTHTKEPWLQDANYVITQGHSMIAYCSSNEEDARRIVACVNRCERVDTETLETSPDLASAFMSAENARLIQLNTELLLALRDMKQRFESCISDGNGELPEDKPALEIAAATITKAEAANHV